MTRLHLRLDDATPEHITQTLFFDGKNCGRLCMDRQTNQKFVAALIAGQFEVKVDEYVDDSVTQRAVERLRRLGILPR